jgi:hypothetical protein
MLTLDAPLAQFKLHTCEVGQVEDVDHVDDKLNRSCAQRGVRLSGEDRREDIDTITQVGQLVDQTSVYVQLNHIDSPMGLIEVAS